MTDPAKTCDIAGLRATLESLGLLDSQTQLTLSPYEAVFLRRPDYRRSHYRVETPDKTLCHLIVGLNLARVWEQTDKFFHACPNLICRPLGFWEQPDGMGYLCLEHFAGETLDDALLGGRCSAEQWVTSVRRAQHQLAASSQHSSSVELEHEIHQLVEDACRFPGLSALDMTVLRELAGSALREGAPTDELSVRWSNGDFIGRNILINAAGELRLIDYEHARPTHFWATDWLRLMRISNLPAGLDQGSVQELRLENLPGHEVHLWLQSLGQLKEAEPSPAVERHVASVIRLLFDAIGRVNRQRSPGQNHSFFVQTLLDHRTARTGLLERTDNQKTRESLLVAELEQVDYRLLSIKRQLAQEEAITRTLKGAIEERQFHTESAQAETERLRKGLRDAQQFIDQLIAEKNRMAHAQFGGGTRLYGLDQARELKLPDGKLSLSGWIINPTSKPWQIRLRLGSGLEFACQAAIARPDVAAAHPGLAGNLESGFAFQAMVPPGFYLATLELRTGGNAWAAFCVLSIDSSVGPMIVRLEKSVPPRRPSGPCQLDGWCFHPRGEIESLSIRYGALLTPVKHGLMRPDVAASYPGIAAAGRSGFSAIIPLEGGRHDFILIATLRGGEAVQTILARDIFVPDAAVEQAAQELLVPQPSSRKNEAANKCRLNETLYFGHPNTITPFLESGWSNADGNFRWASGPKASLCLSFDSPQLPRKLRLVLVPLIVPGRVDRQRIQIDFPLDVVPRVVELTEGIPREIIFDLPNSSELPASSYRLQFGFPDACRPIDLELSEDTRFLSLAFMELTLS